MPNTNTRAGCYLYYYGTGDDEELLKAGTRPGRVYRYLSSIYLPASRSKYLLLNAAATAPSTAKVPPARIPLAPPRSDQHGGGLHRHSDAVHIADGVVGLKQRSLAASDPAA